MYRIAKRLQHERRRGGSRSSSALLLAGADVITGGRRRAAEPVLVERGRIAAVGREAARRARKAPRPRTVDLAGHSLLPGFLDLHTHGAVGVDFVRADREDFSRAMAHYLAKGVTGLLVSVYPLAFDALVEAVGRIAGLIRGGGPAFGIHLEGPYLSPKRPGALPGEHFRLYRRTEVDALLRAGGGLVRTMTIAPEREGGPELIRHLTRKGVVPCFGHSDADYEGTRRAIAAGVRCATHLFNAMRGIHHRDPGPVPALIDDGKVLVELIADGFHVSLPVLKLVHAAKPRGVILVSDSVAPCGLDDGTYDFAGKPVHLRDGRVTLLDGTLAGSALSMDRAVSLGVKEVGLPLEEVGLLASANPARLLGEGRSRGAIEPGKRADLVLLDRALRVRAVWLGGEQAHGRPL
jgi:N-acetylglucosamine-6-phosphate deacetylase